MVTNSVPPATPSWCPLIRREIGPKAPTPLYSYLCKALKTSASKSIEHTSRPSGAPLTGAFSKHGDRAGHEGRPAANAPLGPPLVLADRA